MITNNNVLFINAVILVVEYLSLAVINDNKITASRYNTTEVGFNSKNTKINNNIILIIPN